MTSTRNSTTSRRNASVVRAAAVDTEIDSEPDYLDVDVVDEDSGALPVGRRRRRGVVDEADEPEDQARRTAIGFRRGTRGGRGGRAEEEYEPDGTEDEYEYVADSSGLEAPSDTELQMADSLSAARRRRYESEDARR